MDVDGASLNEFPECILLEIFQFLDGATLKDASLVCKTWNDLIGSSAVLMKKFQLKFNSFERLPSDRLVRKYRDVHIDIGSRFECNSENFQKIKDVFDYTNTRIMYLGTRGLVEVGAFIQLVSEMPLLEDLTLYFRQEFAGFDESKIKHVTLSKLTIFNMDVKDAIFLKFISAPQLSECFVLIDQKRQVPDDCLANFLNNRSQLKTLMINAFGLKEMIEARQQFGFELNILKTEGYVTPLPGTFLQTLDTFLASQTSTLTEIDLREVFGLSDSILKTIFLSKCIRKLFFNVHEIDFSINFHHELDTNVSLKELTVVGSFPSEEFLKTLVRRCPNLEKLKLSHTYEGTIDHVAHHCRNLSELAVDSIKVPSSGNERFRFVNQLTVRTIPNVDHWISLIVDLPLLETLVVTRCEEDTITDEAIDVLVQQPKLRHLDINANDVAALVLIFKRLSINYGNLETLRLQFISDKHVTFDFPEDRSDWSEDDNEEKFIYFLEDSLEFIR